MNLDAYQKLAKHLLRLVEVQKLEGKDYCVVDHKVLCITAAAIEELLAQLKLNKEIKNN
ncbi:hypothetical protein L8P92_04250 [Enterobacter asburiae]|uniref:hypothetical protein n=1 Tax=Enterobacter asburiae TaxID=61645 RepID=UPI002004DA80|nr:hypothetical protein [Enterobacter asburiae]MCK7061133.1 hypothetical protein [Enterobacter asburiae]HCM9117688.1 hypothetical protein [Enterobacter asburiae]